MRISDWSSDVCSSDLGQALEDVLLARRESRDEDSRIGRPARPAFGIGKALKGGFDGRDQGRLFERLLDEIDRPGLHRANGDRDIAMTRQDDNRHGYATRVQFLLDFPAVYLGHADIKQDTTLLGMLELIEKFHAGNPPRHRKTLFL